MFNHRQRLKLPHYGVHSTRFQSSCRCGWGKRKEGEDRPEYLINFTDEIINKISKDNFVRYPKKIIKKNYSPFRCKYIFNLNKYKGTYG